MSFAQRNSTLNAFSLFTITYYLQKNSSEEAKKYPRNMSEESFLVAGVGVAPTKFGL